MRTIFAWAALAIAACLAAEAGPITVLTSGMSVPEDISLAPASFGSFGGQYFVDDTGVGAAGPSVIWAVQPSGLATVFDNTAFSSSLTRGSTFLPATWGSVGGQFVVAATNVTGCTTGQMCTGSTGTSLVALDANGNPTTLFSTPNTAGMISSLGAPVVAPAGYGAFGGDLLAIHLPTFNQTSTGATVIAVSPAGTSGTVATLPTGDFTVGSVFAPTGFGTLGGMLLVSDAASGDIYSVDALGNVTLFTTVPIGQGQTGLRQMAFAPAGYGSYGGDLFVSVSGSPAGGGVGGSVDVVDGSENVIAVLMQGTVGAPFDPRGLYFASSTDLLVNDADPGILIATPDAFTPTAAPEPATLAMLFGGLALLGLRQIKRRRRR